MAADYMKFFSFRNFLHIFLFVSLNQFCLFAEGDTTSILPKEIEQYLVVNGCSQINEFYVNYPDIRMPPYVYEILGDEDGIIQQLIDTNNPDESIASGLAIDANSFAAWCQTLDSRSGENFYYIKFSFNGKKVGFGECSNGIGPLSYPGGLSVFREEHEPLTWYKNLDTREYEKDASLTDGYILQSIYDGLGYKFYCKDGEWFYRDLH